jgi:SAM-dependent methyltransferase
MAENKTHWYDGWFYDLIIAPNQDKLFQQIKNIIEPDKKIIDVGCGTGRFSFSIADKCKSVLGIDLSKRNIERANYRLSQNQNEIISFQHKSIGDIISEKKEHFDYAVITYVIHEVDENKRVNLLKDMSVIADYIIIGDYVAPRPKGFWGFLNEIVEFLAGQDHYRNYKSYLAEKGIITLAEKAQLIIIKEIKNTPKTAHIVVLQK